MFNFQIIDIKGTVTLENLNFRQIVGNFKQIYGGFWRLSEISNKFSEKITVPSNWSFIMLTVIDFKTLFRAKWKNSQIESDSVQIRSNSNYLTDEKSHQIKSSTGFVCSVPFYAFNLSLLFVCYSVEHRANEHFKLRYNNDRLDNEINLSSSNHFHLIYTFWSMLLFARKLWWRKTTVTKKNKRA